MFVLIVDFALKELFQLLQVSDRINISDGILFGIIIHFIVIKLVVIIDILNVSLKFLTSYLNTCQRVIMLGLLNMHNSVITNKSDDTKIH